MTPWKVVRNRRSRRLLNVHDDKDAGLRVLVVVFSLRPLPASVR